MDQPNRRQPIDVRLPSYGVFVLESYHAPGFRMAAQRHDFLEIFYVLRGEGVFWIDGASYPCRTGSVVLVPSDRVHRIEDDPDAPLALYGICVAPAVLSHEPDVLAPLGAGTLRLSSALAAQVRADLRRLLYEQTLAQPGSRVFMVGLTQQLLALLARSGLNSRPRRLARAESEPPSGHRQAIERYVAELPQRFFEATDLDEAADSLGMSRRRFTQLFRALTGSSWTAYLNRLRVEYACQLLRETARSITAVAFECGYEDLSTFYRAFKRQKRQAPNAWRERNRMC